MNERCIGSESTLNPTCRKAEFLRTSPAVHGQLTRDGCNVRRRPPPPLGWSPERKTLPKSRSQPRRFPHLRGFLLPDTLLLTAFGRRLAQARPSDTARFQNSLTGTALLAVCLIALNYAVALIAARSPGAQADRRRTGDSGATARSIATCSGSNW